ncbi:MAG: transposase [Gammaproteobacteria bacterium HGW-Gammaproteobacteria-8]|jgi:type II secretory pathway predicted ATPase ExeA|nr:MAG: transposase [Gammaproteobacteria bacterium HGW-Gammaproteobacteria-8]
MNARRNSNIKQRLRHAGIRQHTLAAALGISRPALSGYINHGILPAHCQHARIEIEIEHQLRRAGRGASSAKKTTPPRANAVASTPRADTDQTNEEIAMLLRRQALTQATKQHFRLGRDPFADPETTADVWLSPELRYVREAMYQTARHGGFIAVVGESGAGKTTLREELIDRLQRDDQAVIVIQPYVLAMEASDSKGKTLKAQHIAEAIMACVAPHAAIRISAEARFRQLHQSLKDSARAGHSHVLIIEEAHSLPLVTLKHLKRFRELKDGLRPLLSVILVGQPELGIKLSEHNPEVREVVQRIELISLPALDNDIESYLKHRFARINVALDAVIGKGAIDALRAKLTPTRASGTMLYPLAVHNALTAALNVAAELGAPLVTADIIRGA